MRPLPLLLALPLLTASPLLAQDPDLYDEAVVRDIELTFSQPNWWTDLYNNYASETLMPADMTVDGVLYPDVGVRFKGNSSGSVWPSDKMPFKIKTDEYVAGQDLYGFDTINLHNSFMDPTFTREVVTYHVMREYLPAPQANYVRLWLNGTYWGIYVNTEQVSGEFLDEWFPDDSGNRYKCDPSVSMPPGSLPKSTLVWLGSTLSDYYAYYELKSDGDGNEWQDLVDMINVLENGSVSQQSTALAPVLDIDTCLWFVAANSLFCNLDSYILSGHNYYVYHDPHEGRFTPIPWDTNEAFGNFGMGYSVTQLQRMSPLLNYGNSNYPLLTKLLNPSADTRGREIYLAHLRDMTLQHWDWSVIGALVSQYQTLIEADVIADSKKLYSMSDFYNNVTQNVTIGHRTACGLQPFVVNRRSYLMTSWFNNAVPAITSVTAAPANPAAGEDVLVTANVTVSGATLADVIVRYREGAGTLYTEAVMYDDGAHGDGAAGDGTYGAWIPGKDGATTVEYYLLAQTTVSETALEPILGEGDPYSWYVTPVTAGNGVVINEFLAKNDSGAQDELGEYEDWVELYNTNAVAVDLGGTYLTDDLSALTKWQLPVGTTIGAYDTLLVWTDDDPTDGPLHAEFKLGADGEDLALVDVDGATLLDSIVFGAQVADVSTGRLFDGNGAWVTLLAPTADAVNFPGTLGYRRYSALDSTFHPLSLSGAVTPVVGVTVTLEVRDAPASSPVSLFGGADAAYYAFAQGVLLINPPFLLILSGVSDVAGATDFDLAIPSDPAFAGVTFYVQGVSVGGGVIGASNGLEILVGP